MKLILRTALQRYFVASNLANGTQAEYRSTLNKWEEWNAKIQINKLGRREIAEFLDHVYASAKEKEGTNPGRTSNKAIEQLRAVMSWAWDQEIIESLSRFPKLRKQRDVAGRHYRYRHTRISWDYQTEAERSSTRSDQFLRAQLLQLA